MDASGRGIRKWLAVVLLASLALGCAKPRTDPKCEAEVKSSAAKSRSPVEEVALYWDVSGSMKPSLPNRRYSSDTILHQLWSKLDRAWVRESGLHVDLVSHYAMGNEVRPIARPSKNYPPLTDNWSDHPGLAYDMARELITHDNKALVLISDMIVDPPKGKEGDPLCGSVPVPSQGRDIPSLFGKCLAEAWKEGIPEGLDLRALVLRPAAEEPSVIPLFAVIMSRNAEYAAALSKNIRSGLEPDFRVAELLLASDQQQIACGELGPCVFETGATGIVPPVSHAKSAKHSSCEFKVVGSNREQTVACKRPVEASLDEEPEPTAPAALAVSGASVESDASAESAEDTEDSESGESTESSKKAEAGESTDSTGSAPAKAAPAELFHATFLKPYQKLPAPPKAAVEFASSKEGEGPTKPEKQQSQSPEVGIGMFNDDWTHIQVRGLRASNATVEFSFQYQWTLASAEEIKATLQGWLGKSKDNDKYTTLFRSTALHLAEQMKARPLSCAESYGISFVR